MNRRDFLQSTATPLAAAVWCGNGLAADLPEFKRTGLGLVIYCSRFRRSLLKGRNKGFDLYSPENYLAHCKVVGAGGMQARLGRLDEKTAMRLRKSAESSGMFIEGIVSPPKTKRDVARFRSEIQTAKWCGVPAVRTTIIPGRRYERFKSIKEFDEYRARGKRMLELAAPVVEKLKVPFAVENHKDQRSPERVQLFKQIGSEYIGACVDTGNSMALLEDPIDTAKQLAPYAFSVHLKDQAVQACADGFLLADIPLGQGAIDLKSVVGILKKAKPKVRFSLELITRDPLKVPCLTERYWSVMPKLDARHLAGMLRLVRAKSAKSLSKVSTLPLKQQVAREDANVRASLEYARDHLRL